MDSIIALANELYAEPPTGKLYHYTSLNGLMGIVQSGSLLATDMRYFNDATEIEHATNQLREAINLRIARLRKKSQRARRQLLRLCFSWIASRFTAGHVFYVGSFTANGNLLSQWRSYCPVGRGVSIGFDPTAVQTSATRQTFALGKCVY